MKKRLLSWLLVLSMVISLIPSTLVTALAADLPSAQASGQTGKTTVELTNDWPGDMNADITDLTVTNTISPAGTLTVEKGKTLIVHGSGTLSGTGRSDGTPFFIVKDGGHLVLDQVTVTGNSADEGTVVVEQGGLLDLGYNDQKDRIAPSITGNSSAVMSSVTRNLVIADGATVRLNAAANKAIGVSYAGMINDTNPKVVISGGRYSIRGDQGSGLNEETSITPDSSEEQLSYNYDCLLIHPAQRKVLIWDPVMYSDDNATGYSSILWNNTANVFRNAGATVTEYVGTDRYNPKTLTAAGETVNSLLKYDMIYIRAPYTDLIETDKAMLLQYLNMGGRIYIQAEDSHPGHLDQTGGWHTSLFRGMNQKASDMARELGAQFSVNQNLGMALFGDGRTVYFGPQGNLTTGTGLTAGMSSWPLEAASPIDVEGAEDVTVLMSAQTYYWTGSDFNVNTASPQGVKPWCVDQAAGNLDGAKWGRLTVSTDANMWSDKNASGPVTTIDPAIAKIFAGNLLKDSLKNRLCAAVGVNPNAKFVAQATTTTTTTTTETTPYRTPYAALQKAVETSTVKLMTQSNAALTPTRNELLFHESTLAYEAGSKYDGSTIHADTGGVYLDITTTGVVNLQSGTVTVTPNNEDYPLFLNGTMNETGTQITDGITIQSGKQYTLNVNDENSPILADNNGKASVTATEAGQMFTVTYPAKNGHAAETVEYTAEKAGEVIYLGKYRITSDLSPNAVPQIADPHAHHGLTYQQTYKANTGYELEGGNFYIYRVTRGGEEIPINLTKDDQNSRPGEYTLYTSSGVSGNDADGSIGKVTVKQIHIGGANGANHNGNVEITVEGVRSDFKIATHNDAVDSLNPTIIVRGIGTDKTGKQSELYSYRTSITYKDNVVDKPVTAFPWEKYALDRVTVSKQQADGSYGAETDGTLTGANGDEYNVHLPDGNQQVTFYYNWNMVDVTVKANFNGQPFPGYTDQVLELKKGEKTTVTAPSLSGYEPDAPSKDITPSDADKVVTFDYELVSSKLIYRAVDQQNNVIGEYNGNTILKGEAPKIDPQYAPKLLNYELVDPNAQGTATSAGPTNEFDGTHPITVTFVYKPRTKTVRVYMVEYQADDDHKGASLGFDNTTYAGITTGQTLNLTAPAIAGYSVKEVAGDSEVSKNKSVFVANDDITQDVYFYYEKDAQNASKITVKLMDTTANREIGSYTLPGVDGQAQLVTAPTLYGYTTQDTDVTAKPDEEIVTGQGNGVVIFRYTPNVWTVTVSLVDKAEQPLHVANYGTTYKVVKGETLTLVAPSIYGYSLEGDAVWSKSPTEDETVTFTYNTLDESMIHIHVKGVDKDGITRYEYTKLVKKGTQTDTVTAFPVIGQKLVSATVAGIENFNSVQDGNLTFAVTAATGSTQEILFTYADNTAEVTINATLNGAEFPNYTAPTVRQEIGTTVTYQAPVLPGYVPIDPASKDYKATGTNDAVSFDYAKAEGNVIYRAVDEQNGGIGILKTVTIAKDATVDTAVGNATADYGMYKLKNTSDAGTASAATYNGKDDVTVDFVYVRKAKTIKIEMVDEAGNSIGTDATTYADRQTGQTITVNAPTMTGYTPVVNAQKVFVTNDESEAQTVKFVYRTNPDNRATYTIHLIDGSKTAPNNIIQVLTMPGTTGVESTIKAPTLEGYFAGIPVSVTQKPEDGTIKFTYQPDVRTVNVKFVDAAGHEITSVDASIAKSYTVKRGETLTVYAPSIKGYALQSTETIVKTLTTANIFDEGKTEISFKYDVVEQELYVTHTVKFMADGHLLYWHNKLVPKGNGQVVSYTPDMINYVPLGYKYQNISYEKATGVDHQSGVPTGTEIRADDVKDDMNAIITYHFAEDSAHIKIEMVMQGETTPFATKTITGYRTGQTVEVVAPAQDGKILVGDLVKEVSNLTVGENKVTFTYVNPGNVTLELIEKGGAKDGKIIRILSPGSAKTYKENTDELNLEANGYSYSSTDTVGVFTSGELEITQDLLSDNSKHVYKIYYTKVTRDVKYVLKTVDGTVGTVIEEKTERNAARVGETYVAAAPQLTGYTLVGDVTKIISKVESTGDLTVEFTYRQKSSGDIEVVFKDEDNKTILSYTASAAVGETFTAKAPAALEDGKYVTASGAEETQSVTVAGGTGTQAQRIEFTYKNNFVKVTTQTKLGTNTATAHGTPYEVVKGNTTPQIQAGTLTLTPPSMGGYVLKGITLSGGKTGGGETSFPTEWNENANALTLTDLSSDVTVVYHYITVEENIGAYQSVITVKAEYRGFTMGTDKQQTVTRNVGTTITPDPYDGYRVTGYKLDGGALTGGTSLTFTPSNPTHNVIFVYERTDGAVVLPGTDNKIGGEDDVIVKPDGGKDLEDVDNPAGSVKVPTGETGTVTRPDPSDPNHPNGKKEDIKVPEGTIVKPDGTIELPDGGGTINPDNKLPENTPTGYITIIYQPNGGTGDVVKQLAKNDATLKTIVNPFAAPSNAAFNGWDTNAGGSGTNYAAGAPITGVTGKSLTLYAQWLKGEGTNVVTITYKPNGGTPDTDDVQTASDNTGTRFRMTLRLSSFTVPSWNFGGWNTAANGSGDQYEPNTEVTVTLGNNWTLYAQWYRVNPDGSISVPGEDGNPNTPENNATAKGDGKGNNPTRDPATGNIEIPKGGSVTIDDETISLPDGGILKPDGTVIINRPDGNVNGKPDGTITVPGKDGTTPDVKDENGNEVSPKPTVFTMTYQSNNGENKTAKSYAVANEDFTIMPSPFTYTGYAFLRWMKDTDIFYNAGQSVNATENLTLKAVWAKVNSDGSITVPGPDGQIETDNDNTTVNPNGNGDKPEFTDAPVPGSVKVPDGATVDTPTGPVIPPDGSVVLPDGTIVAPDNNGSVNPGETIYPDDKRPTDENNRTYFTVTYQYDASGGSDIAGQSKVYQSARKADGVTVLANRFLTPNGMSFKGWKAGDGTTYQPGENLKSDSDVTLTAIYEQPTGVQLLTVDPPISSANQNSAIQLTAKKNGTETANVAWTAQKLTGGNLNSAINASGRLTVPANAADGDIIIVTATDKTDPNLAASAYVAVNVPISVNPGGGSSGGTTTKTYTITATAGAHGSIDPEGGVSVKGGSDKVFTISPNNGYRIEEVRVDGRSVGTVSYYVFSNVDENHTISVTFAEARPANNNGIADPTETGVAGWLQTREHIAYLGGYGNGLFGPDDNMTRAQVAQMFYNLLKDKNIAITVNFSDVQGSDWYATAVNTLASLGIIRGVGDGVFDPNRSITRAEFATIALRFADKTADGTNPFTDVASNDWYYSAVLNAVGFGWITGYSDGTFRPNASITRAEVATIVNRMLDRNADHDFVNGNATASFVDVPSNHWAYYNIMEATTPHTHTVDRNGNESWGKLQ